MIRNAPLSVCALPTGVGAELGVRARGLEALAAAFASSLASCLATGFAISCGSGNAMAVLAAKRQPLEV